MKRYLLNVLIVGLMGCTLIGGSKDEIEDDNPDTGDIDDTPPPPPPPPPPAAYVRGSLVPDYQLAPRQEYGRFVIEGRQMQDADFSSNLVAISAAQKLDEISAQITAERKGVTVDILSRAADRQRAQTIPFRGNPSDVAFQEVAGRTLIVTPLGGDVMTPGNEIAITDAANGLVTRVRVGIRPQRVVTHDSGIALVCNQYSNYISVVDLVRGELLQGPNGPVEIATEYYCADLELRSKDRRQQVSDELYLYVANSWRHSLLKYELEVVRDPLNGRAADIRVTGATPERPHAPVVEVAGVGDNPWRLSLAETLDHLYVASSRGGDLSRVNLATDTVTKLVRLPAPSIDVVQVGASLYVPTTSPDRGLIARDEPVVSEEIVAKAARATGLDGTSHVVHPGSLRDGTRSYNFEDVRNGLFELDFLLNDSQPTYFTDDVSSERNYDAGQKVLAGATPSAVARGPGNRIYVAMAGSNLVQELQIAGGTFGLVPSRVFATGARPFAIAVNQDRNELYVASWGSERLEIFDLASGVRTDNINLGYAIPEYPATNIERGEFFFYNADWSNNGRKACATCHLDELLADGIGFSNGATAPTAYHQVIPNFNQFGTGAYFWNGSFDDGNYGSLAFAAQTRTNCELVLFGFIEGPSASPDQRIGDPNNRVTDGQDAACRPEPLGDDGLPANFDAIAAVIASQKQVAADVILQETGLSKADVNRFVNFYSVAEMRMPANPFNYLWREGQFAADVIARIDAGRDLFEAVGCAGCHDPGNGFTDGLNHGRGADWAQRFVDIYSLDQRVIDALGGIPERMLAAIAGSVPDSEINVHLDPIDYFVPFCFSGDECLNFEDPLAVRGIGDLETSRLDRIIRINLADPDRGFVPGNVRGQPAVNTPSLRGAWWQNNYLHHGLGDRIEDAILGPGHPALEGRTGWAIDALGAIDVHGKTSQLSAEEVQALVDYVLAIP